MRHFLSVVVVAVFGWSAALAGPSFSTSDVTNFITAMTSMQELEDKYPEADLLAATNIDPQNISSMLDDDGNLAVFSKSMSGLKTNPDMYSDVKSAVTGAGFSSVDKFAGIADAIMMTYMALNVSEADMAQLENMTPEMMQMVPPAMRVQLEGVKKMMGAAQRVPAEDRATLEPMLPQLEAAFNK